MKGSMLILLIVISVMILLTSVSLLVLLTSVSVLLLFTGIFLGLLMLIWSILMLKCIAKIPVYNGLNH